MIEKTATAPPVGSSALFGISDSEKRLRQMSIRSAVVVPGKSGRANYSDEWYTPLARPGGRIK